jgi:hypothetical protein
MKGRAASVESSGGNRDDPVLTLGENDILLVAFAFEKRWGTEECFGALGALVWYALFDFDLDLYSYCIYVYEYHTIVFTLSGSPSSDISQI